MSTILTLADIATRTPDWLAVLVYSDYLEDQDNLLQANALRWLYTNSYWPLDSWACPGKFRWWNGTTGPAFGSTERYPGEWKEYDMWRLDAAILPEVLLINYPETDSADWRRCDFTNIKDALAFILSDYYPAYLEKYK